MPGRLLGALTLALLAGALLAPSAQATFHLIYIGEVYPGSAAAPQSGFVELQLYEPEEHLLGNHSVRLYNASGGTIGTFTFPADLTGPSVTQQRVLVGDDGVEAAFGVKPDLINSGFNMSAAGGAACWDTLDCVSWGNFSGTTSPSSGVDADPPGIPNGLGLTRFDAAGSCANILDKEDDTNDSDRDFVDAAPTPQNYSTVPPPAVCTPPPPMPSTTIDTRPASATNSTSASFTFHSNPAATDFECRLDLGAYADCDSGSISYAGPLSEGLHSFRVRGTNANGTGNPAVYSWNVDLTAPSASITSKPVDPSPGKSSSFRYSSNEANSKFECKLVPVESAFSACSTQPKVYLGLADNEYTFEVRAIDAAGNTQATPTTFAWTVDNSLEDKTPPETTIGSKPPDPSTSPTASFTYSSNEPGSTFQCKLDGGGFTSCPATGASYSGIPEGPHTFQVQAIDPSGNVDPTPAGYSFNVFLGPAQTIIPTAPLPTTNPAKPNTSIAKSAAKLRDRTPTFRFSSNKPGASFQCKLDRGRFVNCRSPFTTKTLAFGPHTLTVRAIVSGATDPSPAKFSFKILKG